MFKKYIRLVFHIAETNAVAWKMSQQEIESDFVEAFLSYFEEEEEKLQQERERLQIKGMPLQGNFPLFAYKESNLYLHPESTLQMVIAWCEKEISIFLKKPEKRKTAVFETAVHILTLIRKGGIVIEQEEQKRTFCA